MSITLAIGVESKRMVVRAHSWLSYYSIVKDVRNSFELFQVLRLVFFW